MVYGNDAVLPIEITVQSLRVTKQNQLSHIDYESAMMTEIDDLDEVQVSVLNSIILQSKKSLRVIIEGLDLRLLQ